MSDSCQNCTCSSARTTGARGRLLLATQVDHTATALRSLALRKGVQLKVLAPGLLSLEAPDLDVFVAEARRQLSSVEADEVRCVVVEDVDPSDSVLLAKALSAPTLAAAGARVTHADLLPLFEDEQACFHAEYQPVVGLAERDTIGFEALLRARSPEGRAVLPGELFPAAEAAGWTHLLDRVGRTTALRGASGWLGEDLLFINFIPTSIYRPEVCLRTTELAASAAGVRLDQIVFEVTEGHQVRDLDHLERVFAYYRSRNCKVALDDLGSGYSSLNTLVRLQPDIVKLDKDIVQSLPGRVGAAVVTAIVDITHAYGGLVLAECVETEEQAAAALQLGVDLGQGWLFGRPSRRIDAGGDGTGAAASRSSGRTVVPTAATPAARVDPTLPDAAVAVPASEPGDEAHAAAAQARLSKLLLRAVDAGLGGVVVVDLLVEDSPMVYVNSAFEEMTGYTATEVVGLNCRLLQGPETDMAAVRALSQAIRDGREHRSVLRNYRKDGSPWWNELHLSPLRDEHSRLTHYLGFQHDVTARVEAEAQLARLAAQDSLTGLANRSFLMEHLDAALGHAAREQHAVVVLFLDLDGFKGVNDRLGHSAGDAVLVQVAERARASLRGGDLLARNGGDEFVAVLTGLDPLDAARIGRRAADDLAAALDRPIIVGTELVRLSASVGTAVFPDQATTGERLLDAADSDMYRVKSQRSTARSVT